MAGKPLHIVPPVSGARAMPTTSAKMPMPIAAAEAAMALFSP